jgi:hypothetical protein
MQTPRVLGQVIGDRLKGNHEVEVFHDTIELNKYSYVAKAARRVGPKRKWTSIVECKRRAEPNIHFVQDDLSHTAKSWQGVHGEWWEEKGTDPGNFSL